MLLGGVLVGITLHKLDHVQPSPDRGSVPGPETVAVSGLGAHDGRRDLVAREPGPVQSFQSSWSANVGGARYSKREIATDLLTRAHRWTTSRLPPCVWACATGFRWHIACCSCHAPMLAAKARLHCAVQC
jgi:hypothetical protein